MIIDTLLESIEEGNILDVDQLIISKSEREITTIRREDGFDKIDVFYYSCGHEYQGMINVSSNGHDKIYPNDKFYGEYKQKLIKNKLWQ